MNPFEEHANNMALYEQECAEPVTGISTTPSVQYPVDGGGQPTSATATYAATIGHFMVEQILTQNGFSPKLMGQAIIRKSLLPVGTSFATGQKLIATQVGGSVRSCQIDSIEDTFTEWRLNLWDNNQGA